MSLSVGQKIELNDGRIAKVRFVGITSFQTGEWVGVELEEPTGKNDGAVKGDRYFICQPGHGMFLRPTGVRRVIEEPKPKEAPTSNGVSSKPRPSSMHVSAVAAKRSSMALDSVASRRASTIAQSPTPGARAGTGMRSPSKAVGINGVAAGARTSTPSTGRKPPTAAAAKARTSMAPPSVTTTTAARRISTVPAAVSRVSRPSVAPSAAASRNLSTRLSVSNATQVGHSASSDAEVSETTSQRSSFASRETEDSASSAGQSHETDEGESVDDDTVKIQFAPPRPPPVPEDPPQSQTRSRRPSSPTAASIHSQRTIRSTAASNRQIEELEAKIRLLERKRLEDRDIKKSLEQAQQERDQYKNIIEKLQNKYRPQQQELSELKKALEVAEKKAEDVAALQAEHDSIMELATIDREMAEEKAQTLEEQVDALRSKAEEMELELEILREENGELGKEMSPEERTSAGWLQLEKSNERLREALLRLRDITQDNEEELKGNIFSLESQLKGLESIQTSYDETREKLLRSEADVSDLRQQLEIAQESEEMIEQLSEQKVDLEERVHQLRNTIEELEELRELNDELVINHQEEEKQMQEEIDFKDSLLIDRERTGKQQQEALDQADYTISRYRTLVSELQASLQDLEASKQLSETEAAELSNKSRAMLELNMQLQTSAAKTQVKTIDLELKRLDAQEASEHLAIVQLFLPEAFGTERDSVLALLRLKRIGFKANLMQGFIKERVASFGTRGWDEEIFQACRIIEELDWMAAMADRFVNAIYGCSPEEFSQYQDVLYELEPVERALNNYIDSLRKGELSAAQSAEELERSIAVMAHLASIHIKTSLASHADDLMMRSQCLQTQLESAAVALGLMRSLVENSAPPAQEEDSDSEEVTSDLQLILNRAEALVGQLRSAKVTAGKVHRSLADLAARSLTLETSWTASFDGVESIATQIVSYARQAGIALQDLFGEEGRTESFSPSEISSTIRPAASSNFELSAPESGPFNAVAGRLRDLGDLLHEVVSVATDLDNTVEFERAPAPWVARANELKQSKVASVDTGVQLERALESINERNVLLAEKETELEEQSVRIEMLEARMKDASKRSARIAELERTLHETKDGEKRMREELARARNDAARDMEKMRDEMSRVASESRSGTVGQEIDTDAMGAGTRMTVKRQESKITSLEGAVRYLKDENHRLRLPSNTSTLSDRAAMDWLHQPLARPKTDRQRRYETVLKDGRKVLDQLLQLTSNADGQTPDLTTLSSNKLAWRPARNTARWTVECQKEDWESWKARRREVVKRASTTHQQNRQSSIHATYTLDSAHPAFGPGKNAHGMSAPGPGRTGHADDPSDHADTVQIVAAEEDFVDAVEQ